MKSIRLLSSEKGNSFSCRFLIHSSYSLQFKSISNIFPTLLNTSTFNILSKNDIPDIDKPNITIPELIKDSKENTLDSLRKKRNLRPFVSLFI